MQFDATSILLWMATWPYHWTFQNCTLDPMRRIAFYISQPRARLLVVNALFDEFKAGKCHELNFVNITVSFCALNLSIYERLSSLSL